VVRGFDEIDVLRRLLDDGQRGYWIPEARVEHLIPASRMTLEYFARYFHGQGQTWTTRGIGTADARQLRERLRRQWWKYWISRLGGPSRWFPEFALLNNLRGQLDRLHGPG
jgi:hypothetical protein